MPENVKEYSDNFPLHNRDKDYYYLSAHTTTRQIYNIMKLKLVVLIESLHGCFVMFGVNNSRVSTCMRPSETKHSAAMAGERLADILLQQINEVYSSIGRGSQ